MQTDSPDVKPHVLAPDVLPHIFGFSEQSALARCARVCKLWSNDALDELWLSMESLVPLFMLLAPLENRTPDSKKPTYYFNRPIKHGDWSRFYEYANRIRCLKLQQGAFGVFSDRLLFEIAFRRQSMCICPKLDRLTLTFKSDDHLVPKISVLLMSGCLSTLTISLPDDPDLSCILLSEFSQRCPKLESLKIVTGFPARDFEGSVACSIAEMTSLKKLCLPLYRFTSVLCVAVSALPQIQTIRFTIVSDDDISLHLTYIHNFAPILQHGAFSSLAELSLACDLADLTTLLAQEVAPHLGIINAVSVSLERADVLHSFLFSLLKRRSSLSLLGMDMVPQDFSADSPFLLPLEPGISGLAEVDAVTYDTLEPLSKLSGLKLLTMAYHRPFRLTDSEIGKLIADTPLLEKLNLNSTPLALSEKSQLTLHSLPLLASRLPRLQFLHLSVDCAQEVHIDVTDVDKPPSFAMLKQISFGPSLAGTVIEPAQVAFYLSRMLPLSCSISSRVCWYSPEERAVAAVYPSLYKPEEWAKNWKEVEGIMHLMVKAREEERKWSESKS